jgi:hypothetical protein
LTVEVLCPLATSDSPVHSDFTFLISALSSVHCSPKSTVGRSGSLLRWLTGHVRCTRDSPVNYSGATLRKKPESGQFTRVLGLGTEQCSVRHWQHLYLSFAPNYVESLTHFFVDLC